MSETKFTKGEWTSAFLHRHQALGIVLKKDIEAGVMTTPICLISPADRVTETDEANAKLICASNDLYEAGEELLSAVKAMQELADRDEVNEQEFENVDSQIEAAKVKMKTAIQKAIA